MDFDDLKKNAHVTGLVLGIVFLIVGFNYDNPGVWMLGFIMLGLGLFLKFKKK